MTVFKFSVDSKIQGYHVYQTIWPNPFIGEELECKREPGNSHDPHAVATIKVIFGVSTIHCRPLNLEPKLTLRHPKWMDHMGLMHTHFVKYKYA